MTELTLFLTITGVALILTVCYRLFLIARYKPEHPDRDEIAHLILIKGIHENQGRIPERYGRFVMNENSYPCGLHRMAALIRPAAFWERYGCYVPLVFNSLLLLWIAFLCYQAGGGEGSYAWLLLFPLIRICWDKNPALYFGERAHGVFWGNVFLGSNYMLVTTGNPWWLLPSVAGSAIAASSSKFTNQAMAFFSALLSLLTLNPFYLLSYLLHIGLAVLLTRGYVVHVLRSQIAYSVFYQKHRAGRYLFTNHYRQLLNLFHPKKAIHVLFNNPILMLVSACPVLLAFLWVWPVEGWPYTDLAAYILCGLILCLLIATESLKFLGQPERYLEFAILPAALFLSGFPVTQHPWPFVATILLGIGSVIYHLVTHRRKKGQAYDREYESYRDLAGFLETQPEGLILPIPIKISNYLAYAWDRHRYLAPGMHQFDPAYVPDLYPYPGNRLSDYTAQYNVDYILLLKRSLTKINRFSGGEYYDFSPFEAIYENDSFTVYRPRHSQEAG